MKLLIIVNPQNDFCTGGALAIPGATELLESWHKRLSDYDKVIALREWHPADHISFAQTHLWRKPGQKIEVNGREIQLQISHCVADQFGAFFHPPFKAEDFSEIVDLGTDKDLESDEEVGGWFEDWYDKKLGLNKFLKITIVGIGHNAIFSKLKSVVQKNKIQLFIDKSEVLTFADYS